MVQLLLLLVKMLSILAYLTCRNIFYICGRFCKDTVRYGQFFYVSEPPGFPGRNSWNYYNKNL